MALEIPEELRGDLSGWRFMIVYRVDKPCPHGACCETHGYFARRESAQAAVRELFGRDDPEAYRVYIDARTVLTADGRSGFLLGSDVFRGTVPIADEPPARPELRLV